MQMKDRLTGDFYTGLYIFILFYYLVTGPPVIIFSFRPSVFQFRLLLLPRVGWLWISIRDHGNMTYEMSYCHCSHHARHQSCRAESTDRFTSMRKKWRMEAEMDDFALSPFIFGSFHEF